MDARPGEDRLEPRRAQPGGAAWDGRARSVVTCSGTGAPVDRARCSPPSDRDVAAASGSRPVDDVADVEPVAGDLDAREPVDVKLPSGCADATPAERERAAAPSSEEQAFHEASLLRVDVQRTEKCGLSAAARRAHGRGSWPRQRSIVRAVEELRGVARAETEREPRVVKRLAAAAVAGERPREHVVAVDRRPLALRLAGECERGAQPDAVVDVEERRLEIGAHAVRGEQAADALLGRVLDARRAARGRSRRAGRRRGRRTAAAGSCRPRGARGGSRARGCRAPARPGRARRVRTRSRASSAGRCGDGASARPSRPRPSSSLPSCVAVQASGSGSSAAASCASRSASRAPSSRPSSSRAYAMRAYDETPGLRRAIVSNDGERRRVAAELELRVADDAVVASGRRREVRARVRPRREREREAMA